MLRDLRKAFKAGEWRVWLEGKGRASSCILGLLPTFEPQMIRLFWLRHCPLTNHVCLWWRKTSRGKSLQAKWTTHSWLTQVINIATTRHAVYGQRMGIVILRTFPMSGMRAWHQITECTFLSKLEACMNDSWTLACVTLRLCVCRAATPTRRHPGHIQC